MPKGEREKKWRWHEAPGLSGNFVYAAVFEYLADTFKVSDEAARSPLRAAT
jgi:hypothetical protein